MSLEKSVVEPREFQRFTAEKITGRLFGKGREGVRFLLADEVGLGKTLVVRQVIDWLFKNKRNVGPVVYLCSSLEIASQNWAKLTPDILLKDRKKEMDMPHVNRLTLYPTLNRQEREESRILCFTPETSLNMGRSMGTIEERVFLYYLVRRMKRWNRRDTHTLFFAGQASCKEGSSFHEAVMEDGPALELGFQGALHRKFQALSSKETDWRHRFPKGIDKDACPRDIFDAIDAVSRRLMEKDGSKKVKEAKWVRGVLIGQMRRALAMTALEFLDPSLVVLDEFQNFQDRLDKAGIDGEIEHKLMTGSAPVLLLSATPFKWFTTQADEQGGETHRKSFRRVMDFLSHGHKEVSADVIFKKLDHFRGKLKPLLNTRNPLKLKPSFLHLKNDLEKTMKHFIFRTERFPFLETAEQGIDTSRALDGNEGMGEAALKEYFLLNLKSRLVNNKHLPPAFWKSGEYILSFMNTPNYQTVKKLYGRVPHRGKNGDLNHALNRELFLDFEKIRKRRPIESRNRKMELVEKNWVDVPRAHRHLWIPPLLPNFKPKAPEAPGDDLKKLLIFSSWAFVPQMIGTLLSHAVERRLPGKSAKSALGLKNPVVQAAFYPSFFLADISLAMPAGPTMTEREFRRCIRKRILSRLKGIPIREKGSVRMINELLWRLDDRLSGQDPELLRAAWKKAVVKNLGAGEDDEHQAFQNLREKRIKSKFENEPVVVSPGQVDQLTALCMGGPGVALLRSCRSNLKEKGFREEGTFITNTASVLEGSYQTLRNYFGKASAQKVIHNVVGPRPRRYAMKVVAYCGRHQLPAVLDEWIFLLRQSDADLNNAGKIVLRLGNALSIREGGRRVKVHEKGALKKGKVTMPVHFALPFGEYATDTKEAGRKKDVREAFNSPFWPFVLATTSVGQEGLDFHRYCQDVLHWNLPSNPLAFEQREGRINRFNCLAIRQAVKASLNGSKAMNWEEAFSMVRNRPHGKLSVSSSLGLFPNWIWMEKRRKSRSAGAIRRHVYPYPLSRENDKYEILIRDLGNYRLTLGHPRQEEFLRHLGTDKANKPELNRRSRELMLSLMPYDQALHKSEAIKLAKKVILDKDTVRARRDKNNIIAFAKTEIHRNGRKIGTRYKRKLVKILIRLINCSVPDQVKLLAALIYFLNPFDAIPDSFSTGYQDDEQIADWALKSTKQTRQKGDKDE